MSTVVPWPRRSGVKLTWSLADCAACALAGRHAQVSSEARMARARGTVLCRHRVVVLVGERSGGLDDYRVCAAIEHAVESAVAADVGVATAAVGREE
jgi:hypothetical protein